MFDVKGIESGEFIEYKGRLVCKSCVRAMAENI